MHQRQMHSRTDWTNIGRIWAHEMFSVVSFCTYLLVLVLEVDELGSRNFHDESFGYQAHQPQVQVQVNYVQNYTTENITTLTTLHCAGGKHCDIMKVV